jgi:hypothetical protein
MTLLDYPDGKEEILLYERNKHLETFGIGD